MKYFLILSITLLTGCVGKQVYVVDQPVDNNSVVKEYDVYPTFKGFEMIVGLPALKAIPVIGIFFSEIIQIRAGVNQDVLVPIMTPKDAPNNLMGGQQTPPKRVDGAKARWVQYK